MSDDGIKRESKWDRIRRSQEPIEGLVQSTNEVFTEEALKSQDGKKVPLTLGFGGPVVGEATLKYDSDEKGLKAEFLVDDVTLKVTLGFGGPIVGEATLKDFLRGPEAD